MNDDTAELDPIDVLVEEFSTKLRAGSAPSVQEFARLHPAQSGELLDLLPTVVAMEQVKRRRNSGQTLRQTKVPDQVGDFQIVREIGRGGMGIVYEALERTLNRRVALKILPGHALLNAVRLQRFQREAQTAAQLHHTNIVPVFGSGEADGLHYFVMQFIEGRSLQQIVEDDKKSKASQPAQAALNSTHPQSTAGTQAYWRWAANIVLQVADALHYAHAHGVQHRDIKPANILVDAQDTAWVTDFGLAKLDDHDGLTRSGDILGTIQYMAPESFKNGTDERGDIYSLGLTLYEILTRRPPYSETTAAGLIHEISTHEPPRPRKVDPHIPQDLETIVLKASARAPEQRYHSAADFADDLRRYLDDRPILARKAGSIERTWRWCRRNRTVAALAALAASAMILALVAGWVGYTQTSAALARVELEADAARNAEERADANVEMSLQALEEMFQQLNSSDSQEYPRMPMLQSGDRPPPRPSDKEPGRNGPRPEDRSGPRGGWSNSFQGPWMQGSTGADNVELLQSILKFYERFAEKNDTNTKLRIESARAYERVGELQMRLHQNEKAEQAFKRALSAADEFGTNSKELHVLTAKANAGLGYIFAGRNDLDSASSAYAKAVQLYAGLGAADEKYHMDHSMVQFKYGEVLAQQKKYDEAAAAVLASIPAIKANGTEHSMAFVHKSKIYNKLVEIYDLAGNTEAKKEAARKAEEFKIPTWMRGPDSRPKPGNQ